MSKTNESILADVTPYDLPGSRNATYLTDDVLSSMTAAREDERERIKEIIQKRIYEIEHTVHIQGSGKRVRELNKLLKKLAPCT